MSHTDTPLEKTKNIDNFNERKLKLFDIFRDAEKVKQRFFKEAHNTEKSLIKIKKQKHEPEQSRMKEEITFMRESRSRITMMIPSTPLKQSSTFNVEKDIFFNEN